MMTLTFIISIAATIFFFRTFRKERMERRARLKETAVAEEERS
jgi:cbb3-type cytochrome oxidase subunit 3